LTKRSSRGRLRPVIGWRLQIPHLGIAANSLRTRQAPRERARTDIDVGLESTRPLIVDDDLASGTAFAAPHADPPPLRVEVDPGNGNDEVAAAEFAVDQSRGPITATKGAHESRRPEQHGSSLALPADRHHSFEAP
jgi:hypothetical protein